MVTSNNEEQNSFLDSCKEALESETFKRITFSSRDKGNAKFRCSFALVLGETKRLVRYSDNSPSEDVTKPLVVAELMELMAGTQISPFKAATLNTSEFDLHYTENRKMEPRLYKSKASMKDVAQTHNKQKQYVLTEDRPYLKGLGVSSDGGKVFKKHHPKFRQIANFVEIIDRDIGPFVKETDRPINILDLGCGKGYLTFATYDYVKNRARHEPNARGIDIKKNVIDLCNALAKKLSFNGLRFINARIEPDIVEPVDVLIALHACDTATDDALALGVRSDMCFLFCAPCCQAEIAQQIGSGDSAFEPINRFALMKRRQSDIITDVSRALLLNALGYDIKFLEFTPLEHTAKNLMLVGKKDPSINRKKAYREYLALKEEYGFKHHALEDNLKDLLSDLT